MEAVAFALGFQEVAAMREPIQSGTGETLTAEDFGPVFERQVGGHEQAGSLVRCRDDIEQEFVPPSCHS